MRWQVGTGPPTAKGIPAIVVANGKQISPPMHLRVAKSIVKIHNDAINKLTEAIRNPYRNMVEITPKVEQTSEAP